MRRVLALAFLLASCVTGEGDVVILPPRAGAFASLRVDPPSATLTIADGRPARLQLLAIGVREDGTEVALETVDAWDVVEGRAGFVDAGGLFTAEGPAGGEVRVVARLGPDSEAGVLQASAAVTVRVERTRVDAELEAMLEAVLEAPPGDGSEAPTLLHPLAGAEVPVDLPALDVQWEPRRAARAYVVTLENVLARLRYVVESADVSSLLVRDADKLALFESATGEPIDVRVDLFDGTRVHRGDTVSLRVIPGALLTDVVYFDATGRLLLLDWRAGRRSALLPSPPERGEDRCVGCHAVDPEGGRFYAALYDAPREGFTFAFDADLTGDPAEGTALETSGELAFGTVLPGGELVIAGVDGQLQAFDAETGEPAELSLPEEPATQPATGLGADAVAYVRANATERFTAGDLRLVSLEGPDPEPRTLVRGVDLADEPEGGRAIAHPTFGPEPSWLVFAHGPQSWLGEDEAPTRAALYLSREEGAPARLANLLPHGVASATWPRFAPRPTGTGSLERYWLVFLSRAPFGNDDAGTRGTLHRQLWLAALDANAPAGTDPSRAPVRLPLQNVEAQSLGADFRARACAEVGEACSASAQCCLGRCAVEDDVLRCR